MKTCLWGRRQSKKAEAGGGVQTIERGPQGFRAQDFEDRA